MRYGTGLNTSKSVPEIVAQAKRLADEGFSFLSVSHIFSYDAITLLAAVGAEVDSIELMTAVVPIYTRHPIAMAQQALTVQAVTGGRFALGIGLSHQVLVESMYGLSFEHPLEAMRDYLSVLMPLVRGEHVEQTGERYSATAGPLEIRADAPQVIVAALGSAMLELAGEVADGTATWMTGPKTLREHTVPTITASAARSGRPSPRIVVALPVCVTDDPNSARRLCDESFKVYGTLPSYRAMLDREGAKGPGDVAIVGDAGTVGEALADLEEAGVTDFAASPVGTRDEIKATMDLIGQLSRTS